MIAAIIIINQLAWTLDWLIKPENQLENCFCALHHFNVTDAEK
jgi:hypothetical protein